MLMDFGWHDYLAWALSLGSTGIFIILLVVNGIDDYRRQNGREGRE